jgi:hypothetical protein
MHTASTVCGWAVCLSITAVILGLSATVVSGPVFLDVGTVDVGTVATILGDVLAASAVIIAALELRRAKRSEERARIAAAEELRRVFEVAQLVALAEVIADFGKSPTWLEEIRIRLLPAWMLPVARRWVDDWEGLYNWFFVGIDDAEKVTSRSAGWVNKPPWRRA